MDSRFEFITNLQYKVRNLTLRVKAFESGEKYAAMNAEFKRQLAQQDRENRKLRLELAQAHAETIDVRNKWLQTLDDIVKEHEVELQKKDAEIKRVEDRLLKTQIQLDESRDRLNEKIKELYQAKTDLEDEQGKNQKLKAQINRDYENSATPSSMNPNHKKIANNREKTDRKCGGQPGHEGHSRKKHVPTSETVHIPAPEKYANSPDYKPTGRIIFKQAVNLRVVVDVTEYDTPEFRNVHTGQRVHADFPPGIINDVNYGGSVKAFVFLLNNRCCVSMDKVREFLAELTDGELQISKGMISNLCKEFSENTESAQKKAFADILLSPVMHTDFTTARVDGKSVQVAVCATPLIALYYAREHKGHQGIKDTPVENYQGILVHDHDLTFYNYGCAHQECLDHVLRYLKDSMENEPGLTWNRLMRDLIQEMIHYRNKLGDKMMPDPEKVEEFESRYRGVLKTAWLEYEYEPPSAYYKDGYNLHRRLDNFSENHLLFLHDMNVPTNNNLSERLLRIFKRKQKQAITFRSFNSLSYICTCLSMIALLRAEGKNLYESITKIFSK